MLYLIGLGIWDEGDLSLKGINLIRRADAIFIELYTGNWNGNLKKLEEMADKPIIQLSREQVESDFLVKKAKNSDIALLVPGDPLTATTHIELINEAKKQGIPVKIIHSSSIYTAIAESGLQIYKFGRTTTLPKPEQGFEPKSPYNIIISNLAAGLHSLVLLDIGMGVSQGLMMLNELDEKGYITNVIVCSRLGSKNQYIKYGTLNEMIEWVRIYEGIHGPLTPGLIIIPGSLNFKEEEFLKWLI